jgi:hypothetical protein
MTSYSDVTVVNNACVLDSLAAEVLNQRNRDPVSRANVVKQKVAGRVNRPIFERIEMQSKIEELRSATGGSDFGRLPFRVWLSPPPRPL